MKSAYLAKNVHLAKSVHFVKSAHLVKSVPLVKSAHRVKSVPPVKNAHRAKSVRHEERALAKNASLAHHAKSVSLAQPNRPPSRLRSLPKSNCRTKSCCRTSRKAPMASVRVAAPAGSVAAATVVSAERNANGELIEGSEDEGSDEQPQQHQATELGAELAAGLAVTAAVATSNISADAEAEANQQAERATADAAVTDNSEATQPAEKEVVGKRKNRSKHRLSRRSLSPQWSSSQSASRSRWLKPPPSR